MIHQTPRPLYDGLSTPTGGTLSKKKEREAIHSLSLYTQCTLGRIELERQGRGPEKQEKNDSFPPPWRSPCGKKDEGGALVTFPNRFYSPGHLPPPLGPFFSSLRFGFSSHLTPPEELASAFSPGRNEHSWKLSFTTRGRCASHSAFQSQRCTGRHWRIREAAAKFAGL